MKFAFNVDEHRRTDGTVVLDPDDEWEYENADSDDEKRQIVERLALRQARDSDDWMLGRTIEFCPTRDEEDSGQ